MMKVIDPGTEVWKEVVEKSQWCLQLWGAALPASQLGCFQPGEVAHRHRTVTWEDTGSLQPG